MSSADPVNPASGDDSDVTLSQVRERFKDFLTLLRCNSEVLHIISDMEEKAHGEYLFDANYLRSSVDHARKCVADIVDRLIALGGEKYASMRHRYAEIDVEIEGALPGKRPIRKTEFTLPLAQLSREDALSVGSKNAQLGEMKSRLSLPVPDGFAITSWAYKHFIDSNDLQGRIDEMISTLDVKCYADLIHVSEEIGYLITQAPIPDELAQAISDSFSDLQQRCGATRYAIRSSAIGEDSLYSFAGQYATYLNVTAHELLDRYRQVLASKFTPQAIYYFLSHSLAESELAMSVGVMEMVDAQVSGVVYSRDPVHQNLDCVLINSIYGLGKYLVEGTVNPDCYCVSRQTTRVIEKQISRKLRRLVLTEAGNTTVESVPQAQQLEGTIDSELVARLTEYVLKLEDHYGVPQDMEWAIDEKGRLFLLQTRPLRLVATRRSLGGVDTSELEVLLSDGKVICPGAGAGQVVHVNSTLDLCSVPDQAVVVAPSSFPGLITVMRQASAIVTAAGGVASHMATIAREYRIPTLGGLASAGELPPGTEVTVDATGGKVYYGIQQQVIDARRQEQTIFDDMPIFDLLRQILTRIAPLNLLHPNDENFQIDKCRTYHDVIRFAHQKAIEEMLNVAAGVGAEKQASISLVSEIPLAVNVVLIDEARGGRIEIRDDEIESQPFQAFWSGVKEEGWPPARVAAIMNDDSAGVQVESPRRKKRFYGEESFAVLSGEYMILSLHLGYHFTTVEAICCDDESNNFIRMQYKEGGASRDRRVRRVRLITEILAQIGFEHSSESDFLSSTISDQTEEQMQQKLRLLGRLTMMTKQLDMALSNDTVTDWYTRDIKRRLGLSIAR